VVGQDSSIPGTGLTDFTISDKAFHYGSTTPAPVFSARVLQIVARVDRATVIAQGQVDLTF
jgi:hypothetical protein